MLISGPTAHAEPVAQTSGNRSTIADPFAAFVAEAAQRFGIPAAWIRAVMQAESAGNARAVSSGGAMGLMQIMTETWTGLRSRYGLGADPYDAHDNIMAGAAYLRELHDRYGMAGFLAAYNAGPARYEDYLATGRPLPAETLAYVEALAPLIADGSVDRAMAIGATVRSWIGAPLFATHAKSSVSAFPVSPLSPSGQSPSNTATKDWTALGPQSAGLFVPLKLTSVRVP